MMLVFGRRTRMAVDEAASPRALRNNSARLLKQIAAIGVDSIGDFPQLGVSRAYEDRSGYWKEISP